MSLLASAVLVLLFYLFSLPAVAVVERTCISSRARSVSLGTRELAVLLRVRGTLLSLGM